MAALIDGTILVGGAVDPGAPVSIDGSIVLRGEVLTPATGTDRRIVLVDQAGEVLLDGFLDTAVMGEITWEPSRTTTWSATLPVGDDKLDSILGPASTGEVYGTFEPFVEAQLWRGDQLLTWGPVTSVQVSGSQVTLTGADCGFYLDRRIIGPGARPNLITYDETHPLTGWTRLVTANNFTYMTEWGLAYMAERTVPVDLKQRAVYMYANPGGEGTVNDLIQPMLVQTVRLNAAAFPHRVTLSAQCYVHTWVSPNIRKSGLGLAILPVGWSNLYRDAVKVQWSSIDENFPHGTGAGPQRVSVSIDVGVASEYVVAAIITCPRGETYWWDVFLDWDGGLEFSGEPQETIAFKVADHITGNASSTYTFATHHPLYPYAGEDYGKSDLNIETDCPPSLITRSRRYLFTTQQTGSAALAEFANYDDGFEYSIEYTPTSRTFTTHTPKMGVYRPRCPLRSTDTGGNILSWSWSFEGSQAANQITVRAPGESMHVGIASDVATFANGTTLEQQMQAPVDTADESLTAMAARRLVQSKRPVSLDVTVSADLLARGLSVGDRVPVYITQGSFSLNDTMRVVRMTLTPDDRLKLKLAPWPNGNT